VDVAPLDQKDPADSARIIIEELEKFSPVLAAKERWLVLNKMDLLAPEEQEALRQHIEDSIGWEGRTFCISAAQREGTRELCEAIMDELTQHRLLMLDDEDYRTAEARKQDQMEFEIRQSIIRARALWRERHNRDGDDEGDDDDFDVDVEYVD